MGWSRYFGDGSVLRRFTALIIQLSRMFKRTLLCFADTIYKQAMQDPENLQGELKLTKFW